jgi:peptidoglycan-N-acetylglucosamine deacetylase
MQLPDRVYHWICRHHRNLVLMGAVTFSFPEFFLRSIYNGNQGKRLWGSKRACVTLSFDCDFPEDARAIPKIVEMLRPYQYRVSFAVVGHWIEKYPAEHAEILAGGHELVNHTYSHPDNEFLNPGRRFKDISREEKRQEILQCHEVCARLLGVTPKGLRIPHFKNLFTEDIYELLVDLGYAYSTSTWITNTISRGLPYRPHKGIVEFPLATCPKHPFTVFDTWHSMKATRISHRIKHRGADSYSCLFRCLLTWAKETGSYLNLYLDPADVEEIHEFGELLSLLADPTIETVTYDEYLSRGLHIEESQPVAPA